MLLNNLALVALRLNQPDALDLAEKANRLAPGQAPYMDTLGVILAERGDMARAIEYLGKASQAAPSQPTYRLNFARALIKAGKKTEARRELEELGKLGSQFKEREDVARLMRDL
jgi:predicted Zn-dependent protease